MEQVATLCYLGEAQEAAGETEPALESFRSCTGLADQLNFPFWQWQSLFGQARCLHQLGKTKDAIHKLSLAGTIILKLRKEFESEKQAANFVNETQVVFDRLTEWSESN